MDLQFKNERDETFSLGSVSFDILNSNDIFDPYNEDLDELSEIIFLTTSKEKCLALACDIKNMPTEKDGRKYREDMMEKIQKFSEFVSISSTLTATIR